MDVRGTWRHAEYERACSVKVPIIRDGMPRAGRIQYPHIPNSWSSAPTLLAIADYFTSVGSRASNRYPCFADDISLTLMAVFHLIRNPVRGYALLSLRIGTTIMLYYYETLPEKPTHGAGR